MENKCFHWNRGVFALDFTIKAIAKPSKIERMELKQKQIWSAKWMSDMQEHLQVHNNGGLGLLCAVC